MLRPSVVAPSTAMRVHLERNFLAGTLVLSDMQGILMAVALCLAMRGMVRSRRSHGNALDL
ncbi:hypothetical protein D3C79_1121890 [compost metagenome]